MPLSEAGLAELLKLRASVAEYQREREAWAAKKKAWAAHEERLKQRAFRLRKLLVRALPSVQFANLLELAGEIAIALGETPAGPETTSPAAPTTGAPT